MCANYYSCGTVVLRLGTDWSGTPTKYSVISMQSSIKSGCVKQHKCVHQTFCGA